MSAAPFEFLEDVTSDLCFAARGATLPDVFAAAAEALLDATVEQRETLGAKERRRIELAEPDLELLLLRYAGGSSGGPGGKARVAPLRCTRSVRRLAPDPCSSSFAVLCATT